MIRSVPAIAVAAVVALSASGVNEQPPEPIETAIPAPFQSVDDGPFAQQQLGRARPLGPDAPTWARHLYRSSLRVLFALTDPLSGAMIAGDRPGWDYVWPRDAAAGAMALEAAGLPPQAAKVRAFLSKLDLDAAARFYPDGEPVPGRPAAGDAEGWVGAASSSWRDRQDYGENVTGDLLGNAIAGGATAAEIEDRFLSARGLTREPGGNELDSAAAWAVTLFPRPGLRAAVAQTLMVMTGQSTRYGMPPIEGWTPGEVWTAPTAWSAWALVELGQTAAADTLLRALHRAETPAGTLPERVDATDGRPISTTPLAWSHAFAVLALLARYP